MLGIMSVLCIAPSALPLKTIMVFGKVFVTIYQKVRLPEKPSRRLAALTFATQCIFFRSNPVFRITAAPYTALS